eukprot:GFUD01096289.1.p1 GENE.GFUD01096289.1~~GFUD01096289.1.p1  ORF type:complete len:423 (+),score=81.40 GFUD01096289.1:167-1435(+)
MQWGRLRTVWVALIWVQCSTVDGWCQPGEDIVKCLERESNNDIVTPKLTTTTTTEETGSKTKSEGSFSVRGIGNHQKACQVRSGGYGRYRGACEYPSSCTDRSYGYSQSCGLGGLVCCKGKPVSVQKPTTSVSPRTTTSRPYRSPLKPSKDSISQEEFESEQCGVLAASPFIFGGEKAEDGEFPFMVSLVNRRGKSFCGGVLISRKHVLTAAHCFDNRNWRSDRLEVRIGQADLSEREERGTRANIRNVKIHERYENRGKYPSKRVTPLNDIAIITLDRIVTSPAVFIVCLPNGKQNSGQAFITGWGKTTKKIFDTSVTELRKAKVDTYTARTCQDKYTNFVKDEEIVQVNQNMLCAGNQNTDTCEGDSGGPLLYNERWTEYRWTVYGVVSFGPKICANPDLPGVYTKVDKYLGWIKKNTKF